MRNLLKPCFSAKFHIYNHIHSAKTGGGAMIRTLIVEESCVGRLGIRSLLDRQCHPLEVDEAASSAELMAKLRERYYEFIIVEPAMSGTAGTALVKQLCESSPWSDVLVYTEL